jgi:hypothetical protein
VTLANWRDLSIVWLALLAFIFTLVPGVILFFITKGFLALNRKLRQIFPTIYGYFRKANQVVDQVSHKVAAPVIIAHEKSTQVRASGAALATMLKGRNEVAR